MYKMEIKVLSFGIAKDIVGQRSMRLRLDDAFTVGDLRQKLFRDFPDLGKLQKLAIAVNDEYASDDLPISENDEIILIPPVSGG